jgi:hypothetical protein
MKQLLALLFGCTLFVSAIAQNECDVTTIEYNLHPTPLYSPDSSKYLINMPDTAGVFQIYVGNTGDTNTTCISLVNPWSLLRPWVQRNKMQVQWDPTGQFIICAVEKEFYPELLYVPYSIRIGFLQSGIWMDIMACTPDGATWYNIANTEGGFTGPAFTPNGTKCAWAEALDSSNLAVNVFGDWKLRLSDYAVINGTPQFTATNDITPAGARWIEPGNFHPDGQQLLVSSDIGMLNAEGQDQFIVNIVTGQVINLNNSPMIWDEHGLWSPDGSKIVFMTSYPYQADTNSYHTFSIKAEFMLMDANGSNLQQLTHYCDTGYFESGGGIAAVGYFGLGDSCIYAQSLLYPDYNDWIIRFYGDCGWTPVGTEEHSEESTVSVYPNPAHDYITLNTDADAYITLFNSLGEEVKCVNAAGNSSAIYVGDLSPGVYIVRIDSAARSQSLEIILE